MRMGSTAEALRLASCGRYRLGVRHYRLCSKHDPQVAMSGRANLRYNLHVKTSCGQVTAGDELLGCGSQPEGRTGPSELRLASCGKLREHLQNTHSLSLASIQLAHRPSSVPRLLWCPIGDEIAATLPLCWLHLRLDRAHRVVHDKATSSMRTRRQPTAARTGVAWGHRRDVYGSLFSGAGPRTCPQYKAGLPAAPIFHVYRDSSCFPSPSSRLRAP